MSDSQQSPFRLLTKPGGDRSPQAARRPFDRDGYAAASAVPSDDEPLAAFALSVWNNPTLMVKNLEHFPIGQLVPLELRTVVVVKDERVDARRSLGKSDRHADTL